MTDVALWDYDSAQSARLDHRLTLTPASIPLGSTYFCDRVTISNPTRATHAFGMNGEHLVKMAARLNDVATPLAAVVMRLAALHAGLYA